MTRILQNYSVGYTKTQTKQRSMKKFRTLFLALLCVTSLGSAKEQNDNKVQTVESGKASWYSIKSNGGTITASGKKLSNEAATAAHKTLPLGSTVKVTNEANGKFEIVTITDRGPYIKGRVIDLTIGVAERLGFKKQGVANVKIEVIGHTKIK